MQHSSPQKAVKRLLAAGILLVLVLVLILFLQMREDRISPAEEQRRQDQLIQDVLSSTPTRGPSSAPVTIVEFGDFLCTFCADAAPVLNELHEDYPEQIRHIWIHTINRTTKESRSASTAAQCALEQGAFWDYHDALFVRQADLSPLLYSQIANTIGLDMEQFRTCIQSSRISDFINDSRKFAELNEVDATPYLIINDRTLTGAFSSEELRTIIEQEINASSL